MVSDRRIVIGTLVLTLSLLAVPWLARGGELSSAEGIAYYKKLTEQHPQKASYWNALGYYYLKAGKLQEAEAHLLQAIETDGSYPTPHNNLGVVYLKQGHSERAEGEFRQAVKLKPNYSKAQYNLAVALFHQRRYMDAARAYGKARELDNDYVERRDNRENTKEKIEKALEQAAGDDKSTQELQRMKKWLAPHY